MAEIPVTAPLASLIGESASHTSMVLPSLRSSLVSKGSTASPCRTHAKTGISSAARSGGMSRDVLRPTISSAAHPYMRSAAAFQVVTTPSSVALTIESADDSTIAASRVSSWNSRLARNARGRQPGHRERPAPGSPWLVPCDLITPPGYHFKYEFAY